MSGELAMVLRLSEEIKQLYKEIFKLKERVIALEKDKGVQHE